MEEAGVGRQRSVVLSADATDRVSHEILIKLFLGSRLVSIFLQPNLLARAIFHPAPKLEPCLTFSGKGHASSQCLRAVQVCPDMLEN